MSILEQAQKSFADKLTEVREIEVPEWADDEGNPAILYIRATNLAERNKVYQIAKKDDLEMVAEVLILRARDKDGFPIFKKNEKQHLMTAVDPDVLARIAEEINSDLQPINEEMDEAAKN